MFYFLVGLVALGYFIYCGLQKIKIKPLKVSCPCTFVGASIIAIVLHLTGHELLAWIVFFIGIYLLSITLMAIRKTSSIQKLETSTGTLNQ